MTGGQTYPSFEFTLHVRPGLEGSMVQGGDVS